MNKKQLEIEYSLLKELFSDYKENKEKEYKKTLEGVIYSFEETLKTEREGKESEIVVNGVSYSFIPNEVDIGEIIDDLKEFSNTTAKIENENAYFLYYDDDDLVIY